METPPAAGANGLNVRETARLGQALESMSDTNPPLCGYEVALGKRSGEAVMRVLLAILTIGFGSIGVQAGTLHCSFTEPFFAIDYDSATGKVILTSPDEFDENGKMVPRSLGENAKLVREEPWQGFPTLLLQAGSETIMQVKLTGQGSDGMSEAVFPMEGVYGTNIGGCETDKVQAYDLTDFYEDFQIKYY